MIHNSLIKIFAAKVRVAICRQNFENTLVDRQKRHIKGSTAKVENNYIFFLCSLKMTFIKFC